MQVATGTCDGRVFFTKVPFGTEMGSPAGDSSELSHLRLINFSCFSLLLASKGGITAMDTSEKESSQADCILNCILDFCLQYTPLLHDFKQ